MPTSRFSRTIASTIHNQPIFAVVATNRDTARRAALRGKIEIAVEKPNVSVEQGKASGERVLPDYAFVGGDAAKAIADAPFRLSGAMHIGGQEHFYLEGQIAVAVPGEDGAILVYSSTQHPSEVQHIVARVLAVPDAFVTCRVRRMGGGFGGKETQATQWAVIAALAARITGKPCKLRLDRDADMAITGKRHDFAVEYSVGYEDDGRIRALDLDMDARCGCSVDLSVGVVDRAMFHADNAYFLPEFKILTRRVKTNTVSNTAFRGFGGPQGIMAIERVIDAIAWERGLDPLDVRKANLYRPGRQVTPYGQTVEDYDIAAPLIDELERTSSYRARRNEIRRFNETSPIIKRGIALTPVKFGISFTLTHLNQAGALINVYQDGSISLNHGGTEMGQGLFQKIAQVTAEEFGVGLERVQITATSTDKVPNTSATAASSGTDLNGMAAQIAARKIKKRLTQFASETWKVPEDLITYRDDRVFIGNESITFGELTKKAYAARVLDVGVGLLQNPEAALGSRQGQGPAVLLFRLWCRVQRSRHRYPERRDEGSARRHPPRRRTLHQSGHRYRSDRGCFRPGHGLADHRRAGLRRQRPPADARAVDLQDSGRFRRSQGFPGRVVRGQ